MEAKGVREQNLVEKYILSKNHGITSINLDFPIVGYIVKGQKNIIYNDKIYSIKAGEMFFMCLGTHFINDITDNNKLFEQISFKYDNLYIQKIFTDLNIELSFKNRCPTNCPSCTNIPFAHAPASRLLQNVMLSNSRHYDLGGFENDPIWARLKLSEIINIIFKSSENCLITKLLENINDQQIKFERAVYDNIFKYNKLNDIALQSNLSLSSFKKEFKRVFNESPHRWYLNQRLQHAKLLVSTSNKTISQIRSECAFSNTSHFIKIYKEYFGITPACHREQIKNSLKEEISSKKVGRGCPKSQND